MKLWIGNVSDDVTSDELAALLHKYGGPDFDAMLKVPGDGSRPGVLLTFNSAGSVALHQLAHRLNGLYWHSRGLAVQVMLH